MMIVWCKNIKNIDFDSEFEINFSCLKSHSVTNKMDKSGVENEKNYMWNVFYALIAFINSFSILYRKFFTLKGDFKKPTSQCDIPKKENISHPFV